MALNFADRLVSNNPSAYGIVRAIEVSGHKTVSSLSALYKIPDCILSDTGDNSGNDSLGQLWYVIDAKEVYQLVNWEKRNEAGGWKPYLSGVITDEALEEILKTKQDKLIAGEGISISEDNVISCTIDTSLFRMVDELPSLEEAETNKIYLLRKENNIGELQSYTEYIITIKVDEEGKEIKEWEKIGEYDLSIELAPYLKIEDAEKTYVKKENIVDSFEGGDPKEQVLSAEKGKELKELVDSLEERKVDSVTATEGKGIIVEGTHNDPTIGVLRDPESEGFFTIEETGLKLSGVQDAIDEAVGELTDRVELESDVVYNINEIFPGEGKGENGDQWHIQYAAAKLDAFLPAEKKVPGIKVKFINLDGNWRTFTFNGGYFLDGRNWSYDITSNDFTELATENLPTATPESNGVMSKEDKAKLDGISETINKDVDDKIAEVKETIDNYTVNGYKISTNPSLDRNDIGLGNVTNDAQIKRSEMGVPKGVATLGEDGKVPESQLPDSVLGNVKYQGVWDAVNNVPKLELNDFDSNGHYYIAINKGSQFGYDFDPGDWVINSNGRWVKIDNVDSVKSVNGQIGIVELGIEDIPNLKETLDSKATNDDFNRHLTDYKNPHKVTKDQVGLGNVDNTADKDKPISNATQALIDQTRTVLENKISELQTNTEADLEVFRSEFENKLAELAAKEEADIVAVNNSLKEAKTELQNNIDNLASKTENDLTVAKKELDNKISELSTKTESDLSTLRADLESSISVTKTELEKSISELASKTENDLNTAKSELEKAISDLTAKEEADIVAVNNALSEAKKELENSISSLASKTENDLSLATKDLNNKISELATKTESDLSTLRADLESSISVTKTDLESKITELATKTDAKFQATDSKIEATKTELQTNIDNLSHRHDDDMKDIRREIEEATAGSNEALNTHIQDKSNPHQVTKEQVGLGNVTDDAQVKRSEMGMPEGVATLDATGKVPSSQLPSFVDDVIEVDSFDLLPETGETGKIYVTKDTNLTYRWSGSQYVEISESLALGETSSTAYPGDKGKATTDKVNAHTSDYNNPHKVDKAQVGLGNVDNTADLDKPVSNATQELVDNTKKELEEKINNSGNDLQDNIDKIDERVTNIEDSIAQPGGLATLDDAGKVPLEQLPSLVDDVIEVDSFEHLPEAGEVGKIYVTKDTNLLYRWTGVKYVEVSESLHLGETADTAYAGDKGKATTDKVNAHTSDYNNPHKVDKAQVGLGNVDNTADLDKPVSNATQELVDNTKKELEEKINNSGNDLQDNIDKIDERVTNIEDSIAQPGGLATLDDAGKVPLEQLPSLVDDVIEVDSFEHLPEAGEVGKIYVTKDTNLLYRWTGVKYVEVSESLHLGETADTAYAGDKGKETTDKVNAHISDFNNPHKVTAEQVGLGNVDNTSDINKPVSTAQQEALDAVKTELEEKINNSGSDLQGNIDKIDERVTNIENSVGAPDGIATLDSEGKLEVSQIPNEALNVIEGKYMTETQFTDSEGVEFIPRHNTIYIDSIGGSNKLYRWDGFKYVEVSDSDNVTEAIDNHIKDFNNPHKVTAEQIGLGNVDNTADIDKPISTAVQEALDTVNTKVTEHTENKENPHGVTAEQIGLGNVDNTADYDKPVSKATQDEIDRIDGRIDTIDNSIGVPSGIATLDGNGKLTDSQIPDKTINVLVGKLMSETEFKDEEGNTYEPRTGVIYIDTVSGTEKIYRWNKYEYVEISNTELLEGALNSHVQDKNNPHQVTKEQIGLSEVTNDAQVKRSEMGTPEGVATLNENGKIPVEQLPGQVDEVFGIDRFVSTKTDIPSSRLVIGSTYYVEDEKKIYTAISETELDEGATPDKGVIYSNRETNIIYRWDGAELVEIGNPIHLGEVAGTAYPGDKGKATTDKVNAHVADFENPHQVTKEQIGLGNVDNTSDADKPISSAVQEALDAVNKEVSEHKADKNNPHEVTKAQVGLGNVDNTADINKPISSAVQEALDAVNKEVSEHKADKNNPHEVTKAQVGLGNVDNTADINKPVSVAQQALVDSTKAELKKDIGDIEKDVTNHIADKNNPHEVNKLQVGLGNVDNTSDINKPVSIAQQAALDKLKSDLESIIGSTGTDLSAHLKDFDNPHKVTKDQVGLGKVDNTADLEKPVSVATQEAINAVQSNLDKTNISLENHIADKKNPHEVTKEQVGLGNVDNTSDLDKPVSHYQQDALDELERRLQGSIDGSGSDLSAHISDFNNPHKVTKDQVGLGNVDNTADKDKPISDATQKALDSIKTETNTIIETHIADKNNPHEVTKEQIGLGEVTNDAQVKRSEMGVAGGVATLDQEGKVPSSQLPSFVDDVIEVDSYDNLPTTGEAGKIYVTKDTNLTYRWSGSRYIEISASLALGETSSTAYAGDKGKATTDSLNAHLADFNNPHKVDKAQVGLGNVDNTSDKDKPVSDATQQLINEVKESINSGNTTITDNLTKHIEDYNNPHKVTKDQVGLGNVDNTSDKDKPLSDAAKEAINEVKTLITSSGTDLSNHIKDYTNPHRVTAEQVGLGNVNNTSDLDKPISNATQKELDKLDAKIDKINTDQGTDLSAHLRDFSNPHKVTKEQIGLGNVDNTADLDKPISTATQKAIDDAKAANNTALDNHANRTDNPHKVTKDQVGLGNVDNTADINKPVSVAQQNALDTLSNSLNTAINNHVGNTNNPHQVTKEQVGLGKVDNTSDLEKPISVATQNAISEVVSNLDKHIADKNNPHEVTKEQIGLGRVDNTSDLEKPISTATQVALDKKAELGPDGKIPESQLPERTMHSLFYKGTWDAERNLPTLANGDKAQDGDYYLVNNDGESFGYKFMVNDIIFNASGIWYRMMGSNKRDNPTEFKITKFTADRTLLERGESTEITLEWEYQLTPSGQINFQFIDTHDIPVEERTYKITATGGQTFTLRGSYLSEVATATLTIDTADKVYVGASSNSAPTDSDFIAMNSFFSFGDNEFPFTPIDCSGGKYIYVAIPTEEYSKYRIYCNNYPVDDVTVYSRRITNIFTGYTDYTITKLANLYYGILNIEVKLIDKR